MADSAEGSQEQIFTGILLCQADRVFLDVNGTLFAITTDPGCDAEGFINAFKLLCGRPEGDGNQLTISGTDRPPCGGPTIHVTATALKQMSNPTLQQSFNGTLHCDPAGPRAFLMINGAAFAITTDPGCDPNGSGFQSAFNRLCGRPEGTPLTIPGTDQPPCGGLTIHASALP
jgi:hypothetical protein